MVPILMPPRGQHFIRGNRLRAGKGLIQVSAAMARETRIDGSVTHPQQRPPASACLSPPQCFVLAVPSFLEHGSLNPGLACPSSPFGYQCCAISFNIKTSSSVGPIGTPGHNRTCDLPQAHRRRNRISDSRGSCGPRPCPASRTIRTGFVLPWSQLCVPSLSPEPLLFSLLLLCGTQLYFPSDQAPPSSRWSQWFPSLIAQGPFPLEKVSAGSHPCS